MRILKLVSNIYLTRYQRKLVPYFKKNMLSQKLARVSMKEQEMKVREQKKETQMHTVAENLIELFTDCKSKNKKS